MRISSVGLRLIMHFEGCRLAAYQDSAGVWTIGYGHTKGVKPNDVITPLQAKQFLQDDLAAVYRTIEQAVSVTLAQNQFDALCSFVFNVGAEHFIHSTLLIKLNAGEYQAVVDEFLKWGHAGGSVLPGLKKRRIAERGVFLGDGFDA